ncbi:MAG: hypothetical protein A2289_02480 [Deltaproteobacteria bacterium RIFOXYA12_FULL_58_15]|nr:MAG: hypothetical protein A2289_02480 [Deltaproteobacteria bacterium RIFOXYA12_FULL_58_15]
MHCITKLIAVLVLVLTGGVGTLNFAQAEKTEARTVKPTAAATGTTNTGTTNTGTTNTGTTNTGTTNTGTTSGPEMPQEAGASLEAPPPSTWDQIHESETNGEQGKEEISWGAQLLKTFFALLLVIGLIYVLFKVGLARFVGMAAFKSGKTMKVLERIQLDGRHALVIVLVTEPKERRLLLGTGEQGVQVLAELDGVATPLRKTAQATFQQAMEQTADPQKDAAKDNRGSNE